MRQFAYILAIGGLLGIMVWGWYLYSQAGHYVVVDHTRLPKVPSQVIHHELDEDVVRGAPSGPPL
ncbi:MAG TPA: hypothetical protein DIU37_06175, partial [Opitutae bacterium]|nr:hypothetical protein [Opitutae bacterium]